MKYLLCLITVLVFNCTHAFAQDAAERKELFAALNAAKADTTRVLALLDIGYNIYAGPNPDSAIVYYHQAYELAKKIGYTKGIFKYYACYGDILSTRGDLKEALQNSLKQVALAEAAKDPRMMGAAYNNVAGSYSDLGNTDKALEYYLKAISIYEKRNDQKHLAAVYVNLLGIFSSVGHSPEKALSYGLKAIDISRKGNHLAILQEALLNVSYVYLKLNKPDTAQKLVIEAIAISRKLQDKTFLIDELNAFDNILAWQNKYALLKPQADEMLQLSTETENLSGIAGAKYFLGLYAFDKRQVTQANDLSVQSLGYAIRAGNLSLQEKIYTLLSDVSLVNGRMADYYSYRDKSDSLNEKYHSEQVVSNLQELEAKYDLAKKEARISELNNEQRIQKLTLQRRMFYIVGLAFVIVALLVVGWLVRKDSERKRLLLLSEKELQAQQLQTLEKEKELLSTQALMQGQERERSRLAKDLHDGLGGILTGTKYSLTTMKQNMIISAENAAAFEKTMNMLDQSISELRRVAHNMMPESLLKLSLNDALEEYCQQISQSGALTVTYQSFDIESLETSESINIAVYRVVQELINNVVKHASAKSAMVQVISKDGVLSITVEDDGSGMNTNELVLADGMGYRNIKSRVDFLKGNIDIRSARGEGTSVLIKIPVA